MSNETNEKKTISLSEVEDLISMLFHAIASTEKSDATDASLHVMALNKQIKYFKTKLLAHIEASAEMNTIDIEFIKGI